MSPPVLKALLILNEWGEKRHEFPKALFVGGFYDCICHFPFPIFHLGKKQLPISSWNQPHLCLRHAPSMPKWQSSAGFFKRQLVTTLAIGNCLSKIIPQTVNIWQAIVVTVPVFIFYNGKLFTDEGGRP
jgi:hypothetical protein